MRNRWFALSSLALWLCFALACGASPSAETPTKSPAAKMPPAPSDEARARSAAPAKGDVVVQVRADGTFEPKAVTVKKGQTVTWAFADPYRQSIAPVKGGGSACGNIAPYQGPWAALTGPMPRNPSGLFILNQDGPGIRKGAGGQMSKDGDLGAIHPESWASDDNVGGFIRLRWNWIQPDGEGKYDWTVLDREVKHAVANGKLYSIGVKAGFHGTPEWIFDAGVDKLIFRDFGTMPGVDDCACGAFMALGNPTQDRYQELYFEMLDAMAEHLKSNAAWYRHLAYVKPSGANLYSAENRLPKRCNCSKTCSEKCPSPKEFRDAPNLDDGGRICNTKVWAEAGYTPRGLYDFYERQLAQLAKSYPEKDFAFLLIHDAFPQVSNRSNYLKCGENPKSVEPDVVEQTRELLRLGWRAQGERFTLQHAGLRAEKSINRLMRMERKDTQFIGLQAAKEANSAGLGPIIERGIEEDASFIELYEEVTLKSKEGELAPYNRKLHKRRQAEATGDGPRRDPFPATHSFTFPRDGSVTIVNPATCGGGTAATMDVTITP